MIRTIQFLKGRFKNGSCPQEQDYADWLDSFLHRSEYQQKAASQLVKADLLEGKVVSVAHSLGRMAIPTVFAVKDKRYIPQRFSYELEGDSVALITLIKEGEKVSDEYVVLFN